MAEGKNAEEQGKKPNEWPTRGAAVSPFEEALHNFLGWDEILHLRLDYEFPVNVVEKDDDELKEELRKTPEVITEIKEIIKTWNENPDIFVNPFAKKHEYVREKIQPRQPPVEVDLKDW